MLGGRTVAEWQQLMSGQEFVDWQAWLRRNPRGLRWDNWVQANLRREIIRTMPRKKGTKLEPLAHFLFKRPEPLFIGRIRRHHKRKKVSQAKRTPDK